MGVDCIKHKLKGPFALNISAGTTDVVLVIIDYNDASHLR
jgi:hypothetical protein